jgi:hypothetical protein
LARQFTFKQVVMYLVLALACTLAIAWWGYFTGFFRVLLRVSALLLAYALAWQETPALAGWLADQQLVPGLLVWPAAGLALFMGGAIIFSVLARWLLHVSPEDWQRGGRAIGALAGAALGGGVGLLLVWTAGVVQDSWQLRQSRAVAHDAKPAGSERQAAAQPMDQWVRQLASNALGTLAEQALGDGPAGAAASQWVREPLSVSDGLRHLADKPELRMLIENPASYAVLVKGTPEDIKELLPFQSLVGDAQVMNFLAAVGLPGQTLDEQATALAGMLSRYVRNFEKLRHTPEFRSLMEDKELKEKLQQGNLLVLLTHDKMRRLATLLAQDGLPTEMPVAATLRQRAEAMAGDGKLPEATGSPQSTTKEPKAKPLYRWKDERGRVHITEEKPLEGVQADVIQP